MCYDLAGASAEHCRMQPRHLCMRKRSCAGSYAHHLDTLNPKPCSSEQVSLADGVKRLLHFVKKNPKPQSNPKPEM